MCGRFAQPRSAEELARIFHARPAADLAGERSGTDIPADPVIQVVAGDNRGHQTGAEDPRIEAPQPSESARREQKRVSRQQRRHHEAGLAEDDQGQDCIGAGPILTDQITEVTIEVEHEVDEKADEVDHDGILVASRVPPNVLTPGHVLSTKAEESQERNESDVGDWRYLDRPSLLLVDPHQGLLIPTSDRDHHSASDCELLD